MGLPFNVTQYATLLCMLAKVCGLQPGTLNWSIKDAHIYVNQIEPIKEQLRRFDEHGSLPAPKLWLNPEVTDFFAFDNSKDLKDVKLQIRYEGDIGSLFLASQLISDNFCNGAAWEVGLMEHRGLLSGGMVLRISPLREGARVNADSSMAARNETADAETAELRRVRVQPVYEISL